MMIRGLLFGPPWTYSRKTLYNHIKTESKDTEKVFHTTILTHYTS